jgi:uncharacterized protein
MHIRARSIALLMPASILIATSALAQTPAPAAPASVTVTGKRAAGESTLVTAAKSKVLSRRLASSCNYMAAYSAAEDDITSAYMAHFGMTDSSSNEAERFHENSPNGDASTTPRPEEEELGPGQTPAASKCGGTDRNFASARNRIARKDKSLGEAFVAFDGKDYAKAQQLARLAYSKVGYSEAAMLLANMHLYGLGTKQSTPQAIEWLDKVTGARIDTSEDAIKFNPADPELASDRIQAQLTMAKIALRGMGAPKQPAEAVKWYGEAAKLGFMPANNTLGMAALNGFGMKQDARKALAYFKEAAEAGYAPAQYNLGKLYYNGDEGVAQDLKLAGAWFAAAAKTGHAGALYAAGRMYDLGEGVAADPKRAIVYYKEAALKADPDAQGALATFFYTGELVAKDLPAARKLFAAAARQGQADAMFNLGVMAANGEGGAKDLAAAYVWFTLARDSGHEPASAALKSISGKLTSAEMTKAESVLHPKPKS